MNPGVEEVDVGCIDPDGTLTITATALLKKLCDGPLPPEEIMVLLRVPLFLLRGNLRELAELGLVREEDGWYHITEEGRGKMMSEG